jgi:hypothetical protein
MRFKIEDILKWNASTAVQNFDSITTSTNSDNISQNTWPIVTFGPV